MEQVKEKKKIAKNYLYNLIYQVFLLIIPLAVTPYVSRVLKEDGVGIYSFSYSIVSYFVILGALGFNYYAQREIAKKRGSQEEQNAFFWSIIFVRLITVSASILVYLALIFTNVFSPHYKLILILMVIHIISLYFDISFFFQGNEKFGKIVLRNVLIKSLGIALIFIFVKKPEDLYIYA
ncbi:MAG: oligosaccharide flippase family protein, partial [Anaeroplasmataceae bacterium]|nr:oligosaccharide flippase family protein [Anaeroplasmataceae bacterium]